MNPFDAVIKPIASLDAFQYCRFQFRAYGLKQDEEGYFRGTYTDPHDFEPVLGCRLAQLPDLAALIDLLRPGRGYEVTLCSDLRGPNLESIGHLPLLDLSCSKPPDSADVAKRVQRATGDEFLAQTFRNLLYFASGRSFHAYPDPKVFGRGIDPDKFLAAALLVSTPQNPFVDTQWVGHSLLRGYSALRLTRVNAKCYKAEPLLYTAPAITADATPC